MPRTSSSPQRKTTPISHPPVVLQTPSSSIIHSTPQGPTFGQTLKEGFAFGTGSAIAHRIFNPFVPSTPSQQKIESPCEKERLAFETCMKFKSADDFCGNEQMGYTQCLRLTKSTN